MFNLTQAIYLALCHVWSRLFDGIAHALPIYKNYGMARLSPPHREQLNALALPLIQTHMPGKICQAALVMHIHVEARRAIIDDYGELLTACGI